VRYAIPTLFLILGFLVIQSWFTNAQQASPEKEAKSFLTDIKSGSASKVVRHFGTNVCHCPKSKGWGAYLAYETDEEPNLAFLLGRPFNAGDLSKSSIASPAQAKHGVPWEEPEDYLVDVPISFDKDKYSPIFIPLPMAYGKAMSEEDLEFFLAHPEFEFWKSFSLRLRKSLMPGAIEFDTSNIDQDVRAEFKFLGQKSRKIEENKTSWYLAPKNAGSVIICDKKIIEAAQLTSRFPRLVKTTLQLKVVRSAKLQPWSIADFSFKNSILEKSSGEIIKLSQP